MITVAVDSQLLNSMDFCWERYKLEFIQNWWPNRMPGGMDKGSLIHAFLHHYYRGKKEGRTDYGLLVTESIDVLRLKSTEFNLELVDVDEVVDVCVAYEDHYRFDGLEVLAVEEPFSLVLYEDENIRIIWQGIVDLVGKLPGDEMIVWDTKSEARASTPSSMSNQFEGYAWAFGVNTVLVNKVGFQKTLKPEEKFRRIRLDYSGHKKALLEEWKRDAINKILEAVERQRKDPKGEGYWPRDRTSCDKYSGCIYRGICENPPELREVKLMALFHKKEPWDPFRRDKKK
jgi:hypothetical protein